MQLIIDRRNPKIVGFTLLSEGGPTETLDLESIPDGTVLRVRKTGIKGRLEFVQETPD
jgi:hypothetical protein